MNYPHLVRRLITQAVSIERIEMLRMRIDASGNLTDTEKQALYYHTVGRENCLRFDAYRAGDTAY